MGGRVDTLRFLFSESGNQTDPVAGLHGTEGDSRIGG